MLTEENDIKRHWKQHGMSLFFSDETGTVLEPYVSIDEEEPNVLLSEVINAIKATPTKK